MYKNVCLSKYYDIKSPLHHLNPIVKLICLIMFIVVVLIQKELQFIGILSILMMILLLMSNIKLTMFLNELNKIKYLLLIMFVVNGLLSTSIQSNILGILKIILIVFDLSLFVLTTSANKIMNTFNILFKPLKIFGLKVHNLSVKLVLVITFLPSILDESRRIIRNISIRGLGYRTGSIIDKIKIIKLSFIPVFKLSFRRCVRLDNNFNIRLYNTSFNRRPYRKFGICYDDFVILSTHVLIIAAIIIKDVII